MKEYNEQVVETLDDAGCIIANKNIIIDNLKARIAELEAENARLKAAVEYAETIRVENIAYFEKQLAISQLRETQLREMLEKLATIANQYAGHYPYQVATVVDAALSLPADTSALDAYVEQKVKEAGKFDIWKTNPYTKVLETSIKQLQTKVAELEAEVERLSAAHVKACQANADSQAELAAEQLNNKRLRDALQAYIDEHEECQDADDWMAMMCSMEAHHAADEALSQPSDTSALDSFVAEKVKEATELSESISNMHMLSLEQIATLTRKRDLVVEALKSCGVNDGLNGPTQYFDEDLVERAIKESEAK